MITALQPRDAALTLLSVELADPSRSKRSLGVVYALCLASIAHDDKEEWRFINQKIQNVTDVRYLDHVKKIGWNIYEGVARRSHHA